ncbi:diaminopropionate ammonia-lyase [Synergistaceae bacterium OttesenSCG-928-D05]|nr:diaminopropionate ammonia-lyase [Synergistaceae bacterium OttesenSCG-928-D05]
MNVIKWVNNKMPKTNAAEEMEIMSTRNVESARNFHKSFPQYSETPLVELKQLAKLFNIDDIFVKDEAWRFGLHAFKVLGGSYAIARYIAQELGRDISEMDYAALTSEELKKEFGQATFFSATDGNHGRGVAWAANKLGQKSVILMPKGSSKARFENIQKEGAKTSIEDANYDECVRMAAKQASETPRGVVIQDTAWEGYEEIPAWIMQGYGTMALEADEQMAALDANPPTHVFVQAGVGSLAGAMVGYFANRYKDNPPTFVVAEADQADCLYQSALAADGERHFVDGDMQTIMAGLACGEPNITSWQILKNNVKVFVSCPDWVAARGMRILGMPVRGDKVVISGESGAVTTGLLAYVMMDENLKQLREDIGLDENSRVLMFSTEGNTDPENYRHILWDGGCVPS